MKFEKNYDSLEEKIICYINVLIELKKCDFFVFVNLKSVLSDEKLLQVYAHCRREQVGLLLIESWKQRPLLPNERAVLLQRIFAKYLKIIEFYDKIVLLGLFFKGIYRKRIVQYVIFTPKI